MKCDGDWFVVTHKFSSKHPTKSIGIWPGKAKRFIFKASILDIEYQDKTKQFTTQIVLNKYARYECNYTVDRLKDLQSGCTTLLPFGINNNWSLEINPCTVNGDAKLSLLLNKLPTSIGAVVIRCKLKFEVNDKIEELKECEARVTYRHREFMWKQSLASSDLLFMKKFHCIVNVNVVKVFGIDNKAISPYDWKEYGIVDTEESEDNDDEKMDESVLQQIEKLKEKLGLLEKKLIN